MNLVQKYHKQIKKYENKHLNETCYIFGCGPTINNFKEIEKGVYIGGNRIIKNKEIKDKLGYYFFGHKYFNNIINEDGSNNKDDIDALPYELNKFAVLTLDNCYHNTYGFTDDIDQVEQLYAINAIPCDLTTKHIYKDISQAPFINHSIPYPMVQFALYAGFKKIYIVGCDCTIPFNSNQYNEFWQPINNNIRIDQHLLYWWLKIKKFKDTIYSDAKLINFNPIGLKNLLDNDIITDNI